MHSPAALLLLSIVVAAPAAANDPAIPPASRDRFLDGVHDFAGGKLTPGAPQHAPLTTGTGGTPANTTSSAPAAPASWRGSDGRIAGGQLPRPSITPNPVVRQNIQRPVITPPSITPQQIQSPWAR